MNRRSFVRRAGSSALALIPVARSAGSAEASTAAAMLRPSASTVDASYTMYDLIDMLDSGRTTSEKLTRDFLRRIRRDNHRGAQLHAVLCVSEDALRVAKEMDKERRSGAMRGPLHGIPLLVKDNIHTADLPTTGGSLILRNHRPDSDAPLVARLREAGALILGKTNLSEWANFRSTRSSSGWSGMGGQTRNPHVLDRSPSGSSSGSAAAVAAGFCAAAIGTETDGSIVSPASACGIVGFKPTVTVIPQQGIIPISATQDTAGPMARSVRDCALLMNIMQSPERSDPLTPTSRALPDHTAFLFDDALRGKRIGVDASYKSHLPALVQLFEQRLQLMRDAGAVIVECSLFDTVRSRVGNKEWEVLLFEFGRDIDAYLRDSDAPVKSLKEVVAANISDARHCMPLFGQEIFEEALKVKDSNTAYEAALEVTLSVRGMFDDVFNASKLDAVTCITGGPAWRIDTVNGDISTSPSCSSPPAMAGFPHITVPMGFIRDLPVGISFMSRANGDAELLGIAYAFEQRTRSFRVPRGLVTLDDPSSSS